MASEIQLIANGDLRLSANRVCWPAQKATEDKLIAAIEKLGHTVVRAHEFDAQKQHGFIDSQKRGLEVFRSINPKAPLIVCEAVWQYSQHILPAPDRATDRGELERAVARSGWHAQPQRVAHQGRS